MDKHGIAECVCPKSCEPIVRPVCATDGKTYDNMCEMKRSACNLRLNITAKYIGVCGKLFQVDILENVSQISFPVTTYKIKQEPISSSKLAINVFKAPFLLDLVCKEKVAI